MLGYLTFNGFGGRCLLFFFLAFAKQNQSRSVKTGFNNIYLLKPEQRSLACLANSEVIDRFFPGQGAFIICQ